jgi:hypothetical protein
MAMKKDSCFEVQERKLQTMMHLNESTKIAILAAKIEVSLTMLGFVMGNYFQWLLTSPSS